MANTNNNTNTNDITKEYTVRYYNGSSWCACSTLSRTGMTSKSTKYTFSQACDKCDELNKKGMKARIYKSRTMILEQNPEQIEEQSTEEQTESIMLCDPDGNEIYLADSTSDMCRYIQENHTNIIGDVYMAFGTYNANTKYFEKCDYMEYNEFVEMFAPYFTIPVNVILGKDDTIVDSYSGIEDYHIVSAPVSESQHFTSANTSINSKKLPALFNDKRIVNSVLLCPLHLRCVDIGGGKFDNAVKHFAKFGKTLDVYDKYNRTEEHNKKILSRNDYEIAFCNNVLNVIDSKQERINVIKLALSLAPECFISVYEGDKSGIGRQTKSDCFQLNQPISFYVHELIVSGFNVYFADSKMIHIIRDDEFFSILSHVK